MATSNPLDLAATSASAVQPQLEPASPAPRGLRSLSNTQILIAANVLIFFAMLLQSIWLSGVEQFLNTPIGTEFDDRILLWWGSDYGPLTLGGQYWRILTCMFLHVNIFHLGGNMLFLWRLGRQLDRHLSRRQTLAIYLLTGAAASLASLAWHPTFITLGASGATFGQAGVLIALLALRNLKLPRRQTVGLLLWIAFMMPFELLFGYVSKRTDYAAHMGGLVSGLAIGAFLVWVLRGSPLDSATRQRWGLATTAFFLALSLGAVTARHYDVVTAYRLRVPSRFTSTKTTSPGIGIPPKYWKDESWGPKWDTDADKNRKEKPVLSPTVSFADPGFRGSPAPQSKNEKEEERKTREIFVNSFQSEPQCHGITLKLKKPGEADFALQVFKGIDGRTGRWQYVLYRMDTLGEIERGEVTDAEVRGGPREVARSVCHEIREMAFDRGGGSVE